MWNQWRIQAIPMRGALLSSLDCTPKPRRGQPRRQPQPTGGEPANGGRVPSFFRFPSFPFLSSPLLSHPPIIKIVQMIKPLILHKKYVNIT